MGRDDLFFIHVSCPEMHIFLRLINPADGDIIPDRPPYTQSKMPSPAVSLSLLSMVRADQSTL